MGTLPRIAGVWAASQGDNGRRRIPGAVTAASSPDPIGACRRARANQGQALRLAAKTRPALTGPARGGGGIWRSGRKNARGAGRTKECPQQENKKTGLVLKACACGRFQRSERRMFAEQIELPRVAVRSGRDGLVVTAYLGQVGRLELQSEFHQRVRNVSGGFIGDGVSGQFVWALACHRGCSGLTSPISSFIRKLLPSMTTVSAWCRTRSRMAEVKVLSLLKICGQCLCRRGWW